MPAEKFGLDRVFIESVLAGDRAAFAGLVRAHEARVRSLCLSLLRRPTEADDAAQDVFVKAYLALPRFRFESSFSTWIYRIAYRHCLDVLRAAKRRAEDPLDALPSEPAARDADARGSEALELLSVLPVDQRHVLELREAQGFTYEEISRAMGISLDGVKGRLKRARQALRAAARHLFPVSDVKNAEAVHGS